jgi:hypothetical protein
MTTSIETATRRVLETYALMFNVEQAESKRASLSDYLQTVFSAGETDENRLAVCGLAYLRQQSGRGDATSQGFSGL